MSIKQKTMMLTLRRKTLLLLLWLLLAAATSWAHGGEDHGAAAATAGPAATTFSVAALSEKFELLLRYEPLEKGRPAHLRLFVADYVTNAPVRGTITITSPEDKSLKWTVAPQDSGAYLVEGAFPANRTYSFAVNIVEGKRADLLLLQGIAVGKKLPVAAAPAAENPSIFSSWKTLLPLVGAFGLGMALTAFFLRRRRLAGGASSTSAASAYENQA
ncbi:hypothetical protein SAMN02745146_2101 [Hymenobacter daecheongensis DSM 21074]|uniref:CopC domain-containing protein n=1 Tax=Hymenobacter daecheongensis DSM 21074 TaxID=1121955 RepID=A0A1M6G3K4_9BACT|nr:hypothetical protein [Hymenobacter daecheongensis]SHJ04504.1 hypothetical protein SAMN02745146_2101 [Hymenobacter daecheongensis DSM 21074]